MIIETTEIEGVITLCPVIHEDGRGFFSETYNKQTLEKNKININFVQDNHSLSKDSGVVRGLHFQSEPYAQDKLIRVISGSIFDVAVDLRAKSTTYGKYVSRVLSDKNWKQLLVPKGFAHGFCTLEKNTEVIYKVSNYYAPDCDKGIMWNDPDLKIKWPIENDKAILSDKDKKQPLFNQLENYF